MCPLFLSFLLSFVVCSRLQTHLALAQPSPSQSPSPSCSDLIEQGCKSSPDKNFCINLLRSDPSTPNADLIGLLFIALNNVEKTAAHTSLSIKVTLDNPETDMEPAVQDALNDCDEHYSTLIDLVEDSINSLVSNAPNDFTKYMKAVVADLDGCDACVKGQGGAATQVADRNDDLRKLIKTALSIYQVSQSVNYIVD